MGAERESSFSRLEVALGALFLLGVAAAAALLGILGTRENSGNEGNGFSPHCPNISTSERIDCAPDSAPATKAVCELRGCCWSPGSEPGVPWCFFGTDHGYRIQSGPWETEQGLELSLAPLQAPALFGAPLGSVRLRAQTLSPARLRLQFTDPSSPRFQVPEEVVGPFPGSAAPDPKFRLKIQESPFGVQVLRASSGRVVFDTSIGPLLQAPQFLQVSARLSCSALYGRGQGKLRLPPGWHRWGLYSSQGEGTEEGQNVAGVHPFLMCLEDTSGASLGIFLLNSNAMEVSVSPAPAVTLRSIGGILDLFLLLADSPEQLLQEHAQLVGLPALPPFWALGFQLSHSSYGSLEEAKIVLERNRAAGLPLDALVLGTEAMDGHRDFTIDQRRFRNLPQLRGQLAANGQRLILTLDAAIGEGPLADGSDYGTFRRGGGVWVNESDGVTPLIGQARPGRARFPDFGTALCRRWWLQELQRFRDSAPFDGLCLELDGAVSFVPGSERGCADNAWNFPPYSPAGSARPLFRRSLCPDAAHARGRHYDVHNIYGQSMARDTHGALQSISPSQRPLLVSSSTFAGSGRFGGRWGGAGAASWQRLREAIPDLLWMGMVGIPYSGSSICGGLGRCPEELCRRWHQLGAFFPLARNHNEEPGTAQDPAAFGARSALLNSTRAQLGTRYRLLPHLYTLLYRAHTRGHSVARALPIEFYGEEAAWDVEAQFLWGAALLITPVLEPGVDVIRAYIPDAVWYEFHSGSRLWLRAQWTLLPLPGHRLGLHLRGGHVVPEQEPGATTATSRRNPLGLIVALDENQEASGELFWDDGESADTVESKSYIFYEFRFSNNVLELSVTHNNYSDPHGLEFQRLRVLGLPRAPISIDVTTEGAEVSSNHSLSYDAGTQVAEVWGLRLRLGRSHALRWTLGTRESDRFDCHPWDGASPESCARLGCIWNETTSAERVPFCHYAGLESGYGASNIRYRDTGVTADVILGRPAHRGTGHAHQGQSSAHQGHSPAHQSQSYPHSSTRDTDESTGPIDNTGHAHQSQSSAHQSQSSAHSNTSDTDESTGPIDNTGHAHQGQSSAHSSTSDTDESTGPIDNTGHAHQSQSSAHQSQSSAHSSTIDTNGSTGSAHRSTSDTNGSTGPAHQSQSSAHQSQSSAHPRGMQPIERLRLEVTYHTDHLLQFKIFDPSVRRFEVPVPLFLPATPTATPRSRLYDVEVSDWPFGIRVRRRSSGAVIWDSQLPTFAFSDQFLQISTRLPAPFVYGFGESERGTFRHDLGWHSWGMFARDQPPGNKLNSYGVQPFHLGLEEDGRAHGVLLLNSNAMDVTLQPMPALTYRSTGGVLDFYLVMGPGPEDVVREYTALIGRPVLPPYWALGFQLCRYGYKNDAEIAELVQEMSQERIPLDVQYADIDYMERQLDFTLSPRFRNLPQLVRDIRARGMRFVLILDPAISANETNYPAFERGLQRDVFIKWPNSDDIVFAKVWPDLPNVVVNDSLDWDTQVELYRAFAAVPDFFRNSTRDWWAQEIAEVFHNPQNSSLSIKFDGIWIDMNEPSSFVHGAVGGCRDRDLNFPPYVPQLASRWEGLSSKTLCMEGEQRLPDGTPVRHYDVHSLYGWAQTEPTLRAVQNLTGERGLVVTRSTFPGSGRWAGHWLGDNTAAWEQMGKSIVGMLDFSLFGVSYTGADICGFFGEPSFELCARWMELGAFYPYARNHNGNRDKRQDPVAWNSTFAALSRRVLELRYRLLPTLYSLMFRAHAHGDTVVRPLLHQFVEDRTTWDIDRQFLWGEGLLVSPVLERDVSEVRAYLPDARWFDFHTDAELGVRRQFRNFPAPLGHINLHIRGGLIVPQQLPANNTWFSRRQPLLLTVALNDSQEASGILYWDDGIGIDTYEKGEYLLMSFTARSNLLELRVLHGGYEDPNSLKFTEIKILGFSGNVGEVTVTQNSAPVPVAPIIEHDPQKKVLKMTQLQLELGRNYTLKWG